MPSYSMIYILIASDLIILFIISEMKCSQLDREKWLSDELSKSFDKQKEKERFEKEFKFPQHIKDWYGFK